jgi:hypothetical protein
MSVSATGQVDPALNRAISDAMVELYTIFYQHDRTTATTYINDNIVVCVLENILTADEDTLIAEGARGEVIDGRVAFQSDSEDEFHRRDRAPHPPARNGLPERQPDGPRRGVRAVLPRRRAAHDTGGVRIEPDGYYRRDGYTRRSADVAGEGRKCRSV